eukprot:gene22537-4533_t
MLRGSAVRRTRVMDGTASTTMSSSSTEALGGSASGEGVAARGPQSLLAGDDDIGAEGSTEGGERDEGGSGEGKGAAAACGALTRPPFARALCRLLLPVPAPAAGGGVGRRGTRVGAGARRT